MDEKLAQIESRLAELQKVKEDLVVAKSEALKEQESASNMLADVNARLTVCGNWEENLSDKEKALNSRQAEFESYKTLKEIEFETREGALNIREKSQNVTENVVREFVSSVKENMGDFQAIVQVANDFMGGSSSKIQESLNSLNVALRGMRESSTLYNKEKVDAEDAKNALSTKEQDLYIREEKLKEERFDLDNRARFLRSWEEILNKRDSVMGDFFQSDEFRKVLETLNGNGSISAS